MVGGKSIRDFLLREVTPVVRVFKNIFFFVYVTFLSMSIENLTTSNVVLAIYIYIYVGDRQFFKNFVVSPTGFAKTCSS